MIIMFNFITTKFVQTALFGIMAVTSACGAVGAAHLLQAHPDSEHTTARVCLLLGLATTAGGSLLCAAGAAIDED
tara:strand:- start:650 stop:874 length:225 start_codon:yes stop_codon:yes gene_type:complete